MAKFLVRISRATIEQVLVEADTVEAAHELAELARYTKTGVSWQEKPAVETWYTKEVLKPTTVEEAVQ